MKHRHSFIQISEPFDGTCDCDSGQWSIKVKCLKCKQDYSAPWDHKKNCMFPWWNFCPSCGTPIDVQLRDCSHTRHRMSMWHDGMPLFSMQFERNYWDEGWEVADEVWMHNKNVPHKYLARSLKDFMHVSNDRICKKRWSIVPSAKLPLP